MLLIELIKIKLFSNTNDATRRVSAEYSHIFQLHISAEKLPVILTPSFWPDSILARKNYTRLFPNQVILGKNIPKQIIRGTLSTNALVVKTHPRQQIKSKSLIICKNTN